jgi:uncharacterized protein (DUF1697 family)
VYLFRAVNVGGTAKLPMAELRALAGELGAREVSTYIASGNLLCEPPSEPHAFAAALRAAVRERFGFDREVVHRTAVQVRDALLEHPFAVENPAFSYVTFLEATPTADAIGGAQSLARGDDEWRVIGAQLHVRYAQGAGRAQLSAESLLRALGVAGTARNLRSVAELARRAGAPAVLG